MKFVVKKTTPWETEAIGTFKNKADAEFFVFYKDAATPDAMKALFQYSIEKLD